jgi:hypothetical protein
VSIALIGKLGMTWHGTMSMPDFLPDRELARDVLEYEIWRLASGTTRDHEALLFQAPHKGGQLATLFGDPEDVERAFCDAARGRSDYATIDPAALETRVRAAFRQGMAEPYLDWYHLPRAAWRPAA